MYYLFTLLNTLCLLAFTASHHFLLAQGEQQQMERAKAYIKKAEDFYAQAQYEASIKEYQFAAAIYRRTNHPEKYGICYNGVGNNYLNLTRYKASKNEFKRVLALFNDLSVLDSIALDSTIIANSLEGLGRYAMNVEADFEKALSYHQEGLRLRKQYQASDEDIAQSYYFMARCYRYLSIDSITAQNNPIQLEYDFLQKALDLQLSALGEAHYKTADSYHALGDYYYNVKQDYQKGFEYHEKALSIRKKVFRSNHPKIAASFLEHASYYRIMSLFDQEQKFLEEALSIQLEIFGNEHKDVAKSYVLLGNRNFFSGDNDKALDYYERALKIYSSLQSEYSVETAEMHKKIARCYRTIRESKKEYASLYKSLKIHRKIYGSKHYKVGELYLELGAYFGTKNRYDSLLHYYQKATDLWIQQLGEDHLFVARGYDHLATAYRLLNKPEKEYFYLNEALKKKQKSKNSAPSKQNTYIRQDQMADLDFQTKAQEDVILGTQLFESYMNLASFYKRKKDYDLALIYVQNALRSVCKDLGSSSDVDIYKNPSISEIAHNIDWLLALEQKGSLFLNLYQANKKLEDLEFAHKTFRSALTVIDTLRINFSSDGSKQQLTNRSIPVYEGAIEVLHSLYRSTKSPNYLFEAFEVMERSKSFVLLQALQDITARSFSGVPAELLAKEERLRRNLAYYSDFKNRGKNKEEDFDEIYFKTKESYDELVQLIENKYPKYYALKYQNKVVPLQELQKTLLNEQNILLEYFIGDRHLFIFKVTAGYQYFYKIPIPDDLEKLVNQLRNALTDYQLIAKDPNLAYKNFVLASHSFYKTFVFQFLTGIDKKIKQVIIIPDGWMNYIPFEILVEEIPDNLDNPDYANLRYLLQRYEINYSYSSSLLIENASIRRHKNNRKCLGFAPTYTDDSSVEDDSNLPWAEKELLAVKESFKGNYYFGTDASKGQFQELAHDFGVIHLAMHGIVNIRNPHKSILLFAQDSSKKGDDSQLYAYEIHNMNLNADLVVLSACETGFGKVVRGEGVLSLARAFMYAGVPSVVTTLWKVNDYTSSALMTLFYKNLAKGMSKPEALRKAKLAYLSKSDKVSGHPAFWGSFITIGNPVALRYGLPFWLWLVIGLSSLAIAAYFFYSFRKRRQRTQSHLRNNSINSTQNNDQFPFQEL